VSSVGSKVSAVCPLCGRGTLLRFHAGQYPIHRCARCDFEFVFPLPSPEEVARVYEAGYFSGSNAGRGYADYFEQERRSNLRKAEQRLSRMAELGLAPGARLLDVGCASGDFVAAALARGMDAYGVEISAEALARAPAEVRGRVFPSIAAAAVASYDAVTMWDVLEHFAAPVATLREAVTLMADSALFGVVVPVIDNFNARYWPRTWDQYKPPEHLSFFSRTSLRALFQREVGEVLLEEAAWRRDARLWEVAVGTAKAARPLAALEAALVRALTASKVLPPGWTTDSAALYARRTPQR
jgi:SAM-dependent methyltransferase